MLILDTITIKNFLSFGDEEVTFELNTPGTTVVMGSNGAGKSTITDAIVYALYGKPFRKILKGEVINDQNKKDGLVRLKFFLNNVEHEITRKIKPDSIEIKVAGNELELASGVKLDQNTIDGIIKIPRLLFEQLIMISKTNYKPFLELDAKERREFITRVLGLDVYTEMDKLNKDNIKMLSKLINDLSITRSSTQKTIDDLSTIKDNQVDATQIQKDSIKSSVLSLINNLKELVDIEYDFAQFESGALPIIEQQLFIDNSEYSAESTNLNSELSDITSKGKLVVNQLNFFQQNEVCPTCMQYINPSLKEEKIQSLSDESNQYRKQYADVKRSLNVCSSHLSSIEAQNEAIRQHNQQLTSLQSTIMIRQREYAQLCSSKNNEIESNSKGDVAKTIKKYVKALKELDSEILKNETEINKCNAIAPLLKDDGIRKQVVSNYIPMLNNLITDSLSKLGLNMLFELDADFKDTIRRYNGNNTSYNGLSEGQKLRTNLSMVLAWRGIAMMQGLPHTNLIIFDETFDSSLDADGVESFLGILGEIDNIKPFIISHTPSKIKAQSKIQLGIKHGFSFVVPNND